MDKDRINDVEGTSLVDLKDSKSTRTISNQYFGVKATSLATAKSLYDWIPNGFVLSKDFVSRVASKLCSEKELAELQRKFSLLSNDETLTLIVRSSSTLEWVNGNSFAGLYKSIRGVRSFDDLLSAIAMSHYASHSDVLNNYAEMKNQPLPNAHLGILVQIEIPVEYSALIIIDKHTEFIEYYKGDIAESIQGHNSPIFAIERWNGKTRRKSGYDIVIPKKMQEEIFSIIYEVRLLLKKNQVFHIELGSDGVNQFIFQLNDLHGERITNHLPAEIDGNLAVISTINSSKAEAMFKFKGIGLFSKNLKIYNHLTANSVYHAIVKDFTFKKGITVRYSVSDDISLPRGFFTDKYDLKKWLENTYISADWSVIVHPYIEVRRSFELLLNKEEWLLEHIPGMWESDNSFNPDVVFLSQSLSKAWIWKDIRRPLKGITDEGSRYYESPIMEHEIHAWQNRLKPIVEKLRNLYASTLPLNFHFVEDINGEWHFLNIRKGFNFDLSEISQEKTHILRNRQDALNWDGVRPLQFQVKSERGDEKEIVEIINLLPKIEDQAIIIDFGLLSHPAIILREFGYKLIPSYLRRMNNQYLDNYISLKFDLALDPIKRIMNEKSVYEDKDVKVVIDREQIAKGHLLVVAKERLSALVDLDSMSDKFRKINNGLGGYISDSAIIVERGRARFCTSGFTDSHAHAHILPKEMFNRNCESLFIDKAGLKRVSTLEEAVSMARKSHTEYIMMICGEKNVYLNILPRNVSPEKQLIRNFFKEQLKTI